ncbi:unnamed protein product [Arabis nemorensis]|uniref:Uncharacterized protein n=1 Tax=Arabis nemorensis TaxID=586526 RepID=A0A565C1T9_9BRAS|nr:unnamed protein product [Arabis nemorensis]
MASKALLLIVMLTLLLVIGIEGRIVRVNSKITKDGGSNDLLQRLGYNVSELKRIGKLSLENEVDRFSPGGPDPQHHSYPLSSKP